MKIKEQYLRPNEIEKETGIKPHILRNYRAIGKLTKIKWSVGGRIPYYELNEVKKLFHKD
jgi:hypothetical protein